MDKLIDDKPLEMTETIHKLFDVICNLVISEGGDGDAWVISENYRELANLFEIHQRDEKWMDFYHDRYDNLKENRVWFHIDDQGSVCFLDDMSKVPNYGVTVIRLGILC